MTSAMRVPIAWVLPAAVSATFGVDRIGTATVSAAASSGLGCALAPALANSAASRRAKVRNAVIIALR